MKYFLISALAFLAGCASMPNLFGPGMPGYVGTYESEVDKIKSVYMEPAWIYNTMLKLGHTWHSDMKKDELILDVATEGLVNIPNRESLIFLVDNEKIKLSPSGTRNDYSTSPGHAGGGVYIAPHNWTTRSYKIRKDFVKRILTAKEVHVKLLTGDGYIEGPLHKDGPTTYKSSASVFLKKMDELQKN